MFVVSGLRALPRTKGLTMSESCLRDTHGTFKGVMTKETLNIIEECRRVKLEGKNGQYPELKHDAVRAVRRDKVAKVRRVCERVESHLWSIDSRPAYRRIRTLRSSAPPPRCCIVKAADGTTLTGDSEIRTRWARYFEELYRVDPR